jgi:hypothetical protein
MQAGRSAWKPKQLLVRDVRYAPTRDGNHGWVLMVILILKRLICGHNLEEDGGQRGGCCIQPR